MNDLPALPYTPVLEGTAVGYRRWPHPRERLLTEDGEFESAAPRSGVGAPTRRRFEDGYELEPL